MTKLSDRLEAITGWRVVPVAELVPDDIFFNHLANRRFPAGAFIRQMFPVYFLVMAGCSALAALAATASTAADALVLAAVSIGFLYARVGLLPRIDQARDRALAGDETASARFRRLHRTSTVLNGLQLIAVTVALIRLIDI